MIKLDGRVSERNLVRPITSRKTIPRQIKRAAKQAGDVGKKHIQRSLSNEKPRTGRQYIINGKILRRSAAGEFPAEESKLLRSSINYSVLGTDYIVWESTANARYPSILEDSLRPFASKGIQEKREQINNILFDAVRRGTNHVSR